MRRGLVIYSLFVLIAIVIAQVAIFGSGEAGAATVISSNGLWCKGTESDFVPGGINFDTGECRVPTDQDDTLNFDVCTNGSQFGEILVCPEGFDDNGNCIAEATGVFAFNQGESRSCTEIATEYCAPVQLNIACVAKADGTSSNIGSVTCNPDPKCKSPQAVNSSNIGTIIQNQGGEVVNSIEFTASQVSATGGGYTYGPWDPFVVEGQYALGTDYCRGINTTGRCDGVVFPTCTNASQDNCWDESRYTFVDIGYLSGTYDLTAAMWDCGNTQKDLLRLNSSGGYDYVGHVAYNDGRAWNVCNPPTPTPTNTPVPAPKSLGGQVYCLDNNNNRMPISGQSVEMFRLGQGSVFIDSDSWGNYNFDNIPNVGIAVRYKGQFPLPQYPQSGLATIDRAGKPCTNTGFNSTANGESYESCTLTSNVNDNYDFSLGYCGSTTTPPVTNTPTPILTNTPTPTTTPPTGNQLNCLSFSVAKLDDDTAQVVCILSPNSQPQYVDSVDVSFAPTNINTCIESNWEYAGEMTRHPQLNNIWTFNWDISNLNLIDGEYIVRGDLNVGDNPLGLRSCIGMPESCTNIPATSKCTRCNAIIDFSPTTTVTPTPSSTPTSTPTPSSTPTNTPSPTPTDVPQPVCSSKTIAYCGPYQPGPVTSSDSSSSGRIATVLSSTLQTKAPSCPIITSGTEITYMLTIERTANQQATLVDRLPNNVEFLGTPFIDPAQVSCAYSNDGVDQLLTCTFTGNVNYVFVSVKVNEVPGASVYNSAYVIESGSTNPQCESTVILLTPTVTPTIPITTVTVTPTITPTVNLSITPTVTPTLPTTTTRVTPTPTVDPSITPTVTPTIDLTTTPTVTPTIDLTVTPTITPTIDLTVTPTITSTPEATATPTVTPTPVANQCIEKNAAVCISLDNGGIDPDGPGIDDVANWLHVFGGGGSTGSCQDTAPGEYIIYRIDVEAPNDGSTSTIVEDLAINDHLEMVAWDHTYCSYPDPADSSRMTCVLDANTPNQLFFVARVNENLNSSAVENLISVYNDAGEIVDTCDEEVPVVTPTPTLTATPIPTDTPEPTATPTTEPTMTPTTEPTATPTIEPTLTPTPSLTPTLEATSTPTPTATATPTPSSTPTPTPLPIDKDLAGEIFCSDGGDRYPINGAIVVVYDQYGNSYITQTNALGMYNTNVPIGAGEPPTQYSVAVIGFNGDSGTITETGRYYTDMRPPQAGNNNFALYCDGSNSNNLGITGCVGNQLTCGNYSLGDARSYSMCGMVEANTYDNFDFGFTNCGGAVVSPTPSVSTTPMPTITPAPGCGNVCDPNNNSGTQCPINHTCAYDQGIFRCMLRECANNPGLCDNICALPAAAGLITEKTAQGRGSFILGDTVRFNVSVTNNTSQTYNVLSFEDRYDYNHLSIETIRYNGNDVTEQFRGSDGLGAIIEDESGSRITHRDITVITGDIRPGQKIEFEFTFRVETNELMAQTCNEFFVDPNPLDGEVDRMGDKACINTYSSFPETDL